MFSFPAVLDPKVNESRPSPWLMMMEGRAIFEWASSLLTLPALSTQLPHGDGHAVLVIPGFMAGDVSTGVLRKFLSKRGYKVHGWGQGRNLGPRDGVFEELRTTLKRIASESGGKVSVVGWSLGGVFARELARDLPDLVRQVITLGSPLYGDPKTTTNVWRTYKFMSGRYKVDSKERGHCQPPVPTTSIYTRGDGVVGWGCCVEKAGPIADNIEINAASHLGMGVNPLVLYAIGDRLALRENGWHHFKPRGMMRALYPFRPPKREHVASSHS